MRRHLAAGILSYVLAISVLVSTGLSLLILYVYYSRMEYKMLEKRIQLVKNLQSAQEITLGEYDYFTPGETYFFDLYGKGLDSVGIERIKWGLLDVYRVRSFFKDMVKQQAYTIGHIPHKKGRATLFLADEGRPLSVVGETKLVGDCYLPLAGIQSAYVNRIGYKNEQLIYGSELRSDEELPEVRLEETFERLEQLRLLPAGPVDDTVSNSFFNKTRELSAIKLTLNSVYSGNLFIKGVQKLVFDSLSRTSNIVAYAPVIELKSGFEGDGQFFVSDTLIIHEGVTLNYPSVLAAYNEDEPAIIQTRGDASLTGWILMDGRDDGFRRRLIYLEDGTHLTGMIYCDGLLETYGDITGHVTTRRFLVNAPTAVYENYLFNASIDATKLDSAFLSLSQWFYDDEARILRYLD